ncbi:MAG: MFS transporter [Deltaproteobacteria bacterium]|nr:MFS transporter [Deltaproteobacteria bacterium]
MNIKVIFAFLISLGLGITFLNIPPAMDTLMPLYGVSYTGMSVLLSALLWSHALMQVPAGMIADKLGVERALILGMSSLTVGNFLPAALPSVGLAILGRVLTGIGTGLGFVTGMKLIALYAPDGRAGAFQSFFAGIFSAGNILAYLVIPRLLPLGWQWTYLAPGILSSFLLLLTRGIHVEYPDQDSPSPMSLSGILKIRAAWVLGLYHALSWGTMINLGNWIPSLLAEFWAGSTASQLAWGGMFVMFVSGLARVSGGFILFRFSPMLIANGSILILAFIFTGLFFVPVPAVLLFLAISAAWFSCINFGAFFHLASTMVKRESLGTIIGVVNFLANLGAVLFTLAFGLAKDWAGSLSSGFIVLTILAILAFAFGRGILRRECGVSSCQQQD